MKRTYRLHGLERRRARALEECRLSLARAVNARVAAEGQVQRLRRDEERTRQALLREIGDPVALKMWSEMADAHRRARTGAVAQLGNAHAAEASAREAVTVSHQQLRVLERLRERIEEEARMEAARAEERELNDRNAGRHARRMLSEGM
ncbi:MAG TPA: hypothetical protein VMS93_10155 [Candidatus Saccharimonadales bacterium]|nr:hypothetical protein [Candidatus Saccharimonadales bacterium]